MTLTQLKYYCDACLCGSITGSAKKNFVTQPAVTAAIRSLESEYDTTLIKKVGKQIILTKDGEILFKYAEDLLNHAQTLDEKVRELTRRESTLRLGLTKSAGSSAYLEYVAGSHGMPELEKVSPVTGSSSQLLGKLRDGQLDAIIAPDYGIDAMKDMDRVVLRKTRAMYCVPLTHALSGAQTVEPSLIAGEKMVSTVGDENRAEHLRRIFERSGCPGPDIVWRTEQLSIAIRMVEQGIGTGYFPEDEARNYRGISLLSVEGDQPIPVCAIWLRENGKKAQIRTFVESIHAWFAKEQPH